MTTRRSTPGPAVRTWLASHWADLVLWLLIAAYIAYFGALTVQKHLAFQTTAYDLGNVDQAVWNTRHGRPLAMTNIEGLSNRLGTHVEPILLPISLLYFVWSDPRALLLLQTVVIALGAWPVYQIARRALSTAPHASPLAQRLLSLTFSVAYLLYPALQSANVFDFHALSLAPTFFLFAFYFLETERWAGFAVFSLLTLSCKEDMPLLVAMLGLYALLARRGGGRRRWLGVATLAVSLAWFLVAVGWIMPHFDTQGVSPLAGRYTYLGDGPLEMAVSLVTRPGLVVEHLVEAGAPAYLRDMLLPAAFLSLLAPQVLLLAVPTLAINLLSTDGFMHQLERFHYGAPLAAVVVISAATGAGWLLRHSRGGRLARTLPLLLAGLVLACTLLYHRSHGDTPLATDARGGWPTATVHDRLGEAMAQSIPTSASLAALPYLNPHGSQRQQLSMIDRLENGLPAPLHDADYVWLDVTNGWPLHPNDLKTGIDNLLAGGYGVEQAVDGWLLLRRGAAEKELPAAFYDFALLRSPEPLPQHPLRLRFLLDGKPALECLGYDLDYDPRTKSHRLTFYWRALTPLPSGLRLYPFYFDDATGQIIEDTTQRPMIATVWLPPERWPVGETIQTSTLPWDVGTDFSVGLGVVRGDEWSQVEQRLPIEVAGSDDVVRLFDGSTWARLLHVQDGAPVEERRSFDAPSPQHPLDASFGGKLRLLGYDLTCSGRGDACLSGQNGEAGVVLYWQAQQPMDTSYTVTVQLLDPEGRVQAQSDSIPQGGGYPTTWWLPGEVVADAHRLHSLRSPADTPAGAYRLIVGLYDGTTGDRLPVEGSGADSMELAVLRKQ